MGSLGQRFDRGVDNLLVRSGGEGEGEGKKSGKILRQGRP